MSSRLDPPAPTAAGRRRARVRAAWLGLAALAFSCSEVPLDDQRPDARLFPARGVLRGSVVYRGPRPCSRLGHVVGNAVVTVFRAEAPPPPAGIGRRAVNFVAVPGDVLFADEPRHIGDDLYCPPDDVTVTRTSPFTLAPLDAGAYVVAAFYERAGRFHPAFSFRNQPEAGDVVGGVVDGAAASDDPLAAAALAPVTVGVPDASGALTIPASGFVADNLVVTLGRRLPLSRPYFHLAGADILPDPLTSPGNPGGDARWVPVVTMTQDHAVLAPPSRPTAATLAALEASFPRLDFLWGVPPQEHPTAVDLRGPFGFPLDEPPAGGLVVWKKGRTIPESAAVPDLWPEVVLTRLVDDPRHTLDPQSLAVQGGGGAPLVLLTAIPLAGGSLAASAAGAAPDLPGAGVDGLTALVRPAALCLDPERPAAGGTLVLPHLVARSADPAEAGERPLLDPSNPSALSPLASQVVEGCLPTGRYAVSLVYPTGQTWTVPNESGSCAALEGSTVLGGDVGTCATRPRPVLVSQGTRAVLEILPAFTPEGIALCQAAPTPPECLAPGAR